MLVNAHDIKDILSCIEVLYLLNQSIKMFMQDDSIKIQDNLDFLEQEIRNNNLIITKLRELKQHIKNRLDNHYLQSLEIEFSVLENRLSSSINQLTETKQNIINYLNNFNFNTKKSTIQLLVQVLDWFKEKNSICSYKIYSSTTFQEYDIIDQLLNSYYKSQKHSLTPTTTPPTDQQQQQFLITLTQCIDIKESIDTRPLLCYPIINSYKFFNLPKHPIVEPIINSQLDLFINSKTTPRKNNNENDNNIDNVFVICDKDHNHYTARLFYYISESKFQFNYLFFVKTLDDCKNILIKFGIVGKNFSHSPIVRNRELIDLFNSTINFKANHPNVNIFGEHVLEPLSNESKKFLFNNLTDSIVSKDDILYKPLMSSITHFTLEFMIEELTKEIRNKTKTPNDIIYSRLSYDIHTISPSEIKPEHIIFKIPVGQMLCSFEVNYFKSQTKQNNEWVPITIMQSPNECTDPYQLIFTSEYAQIIVNNNTNGDVYNIKFDLRFKKICFNSFYKESCANLIPLSGTFESRSQGIQPLSLSNCFGTILNQPTQDYRRILDNHIDKIVDEIDGIGYSFCLNNNNNNQNSEKRIAIRLEAGEDRINFINIEGNIHFIGGVKFINDTDHN
ncbi:hypothetical protein CYY_006535 [Polysphondylium violaceum]|uniref:Uncharacterized protein n=1 Tax=Polysphondylium violaceum TaxID=133409 RepID=A0A8J4PR75_9MYCE|nr:hypothetical protein CYY_006535 [Polysphondylium violaceum]